MKKSLPTCICSPFPKGMKLTLAYLTIFCFTDPSGEPKMFLHPQEASIYLQTYLHISLDPPPHTVSPHPQDT